MGNEDGIMEKLKKLMGEPVCNIMHAMYDQFTEANGEHFLKAGLKSIVKRVELGNCCNWCKGLVGAYDYSGGDYPEDIFHRHDNCKCMVTVKTEKGTVQDAWSKKEFESEKEARIARIDELGKKKINHTTTSITKEKRRKLQLEHNTKNIPTVVLSKEEYGKVIHELNNNLSNEQKNKFIVSKAIGNHVYTFENYGFNDYRIIGKELIEEK